MTFIEEPITPAAADRLTSVEVQQLIRQRSGQTVETSHLPTSPCACIPEVVEIKEGNRSYVKVLPNKFPTLELPHLTIWRCADCKDEFVLAPGQTPDEHSAKVQEARANFPGVGVGSDIQVLING